MFAWSAVAGRPQKDAKDAVISAEMVIQLAVTVLLAVVAGYAALMSYAHKAETATVNERMVGIERDVLRLGDSLKGIGVTQGSWNEVQHQFQLEYVKGHTELTTKLEVWNTLLKTTFGEIQADRVEMLAALPRIETHLEDLKRAIKDARTKLKEREQTEQ